MRYMALLFLAALAACGDDPVEPPTDEPFRLDATFASDPIYVETDGLGDAYGAMRLVFTREEETDTLPPANKAHKGSPIVHAWRYRIYGSDTLSAELDRGYYASDDGGATITVANVEWMEGTVYRDGNEVAARASWTRYTDPSTYVDVLLRKR